MLSADTEARTKPAMMRILARAASEKSQKRLVLRALRSMSKSAVRLAHPAWPGGPPSWARPGRC